MDNKLANLVCFIIAASTFAFIGLDATARHGLTHSGTQPNTIIVKGSSK